MSLSDHGNDARLDGPQRRRHALEAWPPDRFGLPLRIYLPALWRARELIVSVLVGCLLLGALGSALIPRKYEALAVISPVSDSPSLPSSSGGSAGLLSLASKVGIGGATNDDFDKYKALLQSERLADWLEHKHGILKTILWKRWDPDRKRWREPNVVFTTIAGALGWKWSPPDSRQLLKWLDNEVDIAPQADVSQGLGALKNQLIVVSLRFTDRNTAIALLTKILNGADTLAREDRLRKAENRITYLQAAIKSTTDVDLLGSLRSLLMDQERTLMTAKVDRYYAIDMLDPPHEATERTGIPLGLWLAGSVILGFFVSAGWVFLIVRRRVDEAYGTHTDPLQEPFPGLIGVLGRIVLRPFRHAMFRKREGAVE